MEGKKFGPLPLVRMIKVSFHYNKHNCVLLDHSNVGMFDQLQDSLHGSKETGPPEVPGNQVGDGMRQKRVEREGALTHQLNEALGHLIGRLNTGPQTRRSPAGISSFPLLPD